MHRPPGQTAVDPETGEWYDDLLVIQVPSESEKRALVDDERLPFFTIDHFKGYNAVLVQQSRLGEIEPRRAGRDHHGRVADQGAQVPGRRRSWRPPMAEPRSRGQQRGTPPADAPGARKIVLDPARAAALDVLKAVRVDRAYANLVLPAVIRHYELERARRGVRHRAGVGDDPATRHLRRDPGGLHRPAAVEGRVEGARRAAARHPPAAVDAGARPRRDQHHRRPGPGPGQHRRRQLRQRGAPLGERARLRRVDREDHPRRAGVADPVRRDRLQPPGVGGRRAARGGRPGRAARAARRRQRESPGHPGRATRPLHP